MNYNETIDFLYCSTPMFQQVGASAYKPGLERVELMAAHFKNPHRLFPSIHVGGTNGKGSTVSTLAAILQSAGYKVGLFTSPHLIDFRERIRINGVMIAESEVVEFVERSQPLIEQFHPSFFELTTLMAFDHYARHQVDIALIEVGMGGRLDSTNIIQPLLSVITNVSLDHTQYLGHTIEAIAGEKAGNIKSGRPVVIGEYTPDTKAVYQAFADKKGAPITFAQEAHVVNNIESLPIGLRVSSVDYGTFDTQLGGTAQMANVQTILTAVRTLNDIAGWHIPREAVHRGFADVIQMSGLRGRWETISEHPHIIIDTGHNPAGIALVCEQLKREQYDRLHIVFGMVSDKDVSSVIALLPQAAHYYFCAPQCERAMSPDDLQSKALERHLQGTPYESVALAIAAAIGQANENDLIYIGGSNFVISETIDYLNKKKNYITIINK